MRGECTTRVAIRARESTPPPRPGALPPLKNAGLLTRIGLDRASPSLAAAHHSTSLCTLSTPPCPHLPAAATAAASSPPQQRMAGEERAKRRSKRAAHSIHQRRRVELRTTEARRKGDVQPSSTVESDRCRSRISLLLSLHLRSALPFLGLLFVGVVSIPPPGSHVARNWHAHSSSAGRDDGSAWTRVGHHTSDRARTDSQCLRRRTQTEETEALDAGVPRRTDVPV